MVSILLNSGAYWDAIENSDSAKNLGDAFQLMVCLSKINGRANSAIRVILSKPEVRNTFLVRPLIQSSVEGVSPEAARATTHFLVGHLGFPGVVALDLVAAKVPDLLRL